MGIAITFGALEGICRMVMGNLGLPAMQLSPAAGRCIGPLPNSAVEYTGWALRMKPVMHDVNGLGYRGEERQHNKPSGWSRIIFVGDSFTYGQGVKSEEALPAALEQVLRQRGQQVEVLNFGVPGYNLEEYLDQYRLFASKWQHDLLLVGLANNDLSRPICDLLSQRLLSWSLKHIYSFRAAYLSWSVFLTRGHGSLDSSDGPAQLEARLRGGLSQLVQLSRQLGARAGLVLMGEESINGLPSAKLAEASASAPLPSLNTKQCTPDGEIPSLPSEGHFTAEGNRIVAACIADWVAATNLLGRR